MSHEKELILFRERIWGKGFTKRHNAFVITELRGIKNVWHDIHSACRELERTLKVNAWATSIYVPKGWMESVVNHINDLLLLSELLHDSVRELRDYVPEDWLDRV